MVFRINFLSFGRQIGPLIKPVNQFSWQQRKIHTTVIRSGLIRRYFRGVLSYSKERRMSPPWKHCTQIGERKNSSICTYFDGFDHFKIISLLQAIQYCGKKQPRSQLSTFETITIN